MGLFPAAGVLVATAPTDEEHAMRTYAFPEISELHDQLTQTPPALRLRQILDVERTISMIEPGERYPVQFVSRWIAGARPTAPVIGRLLPARRLIPDLVRLAPPFRPQR